MASSSSVADSNRPARRYDPKRTEGKRHSQAVLSLARRRNVPWAMLRDNQPYL
jgi:hypothetical protein